MEPQRGEVPCAQRHTASKQQRRSLGPALGNCKASLLSTTLTEEIAKGSCLEEV